LRPVLVSALFILLPACGFHLRQPPTLPEAMKITYVQAPNPGSELVRSLKRSIAAGAEHLTNDPSAATATLRILRDRPSNRLLSVNEQGRPQEYQLVYAVTFLLQADGKQLLAPQTLSLTRSYRYNERDVLGSRQESQLLLRAMQQDMAQLILRRLEAAGRHSAG
jgi:LPS-assembly lipoprotein